MYSYYSRTFLSNFLNCSSFILKYGINLHAFTSCANVILHSREFIKRDNIKYVSSHDISVLLNVLHV